jgi:alpha-D-xyloside xylohydrolase
MKFRHGAWLWREDVTPSVARRLYRYEIANNAVRLWTLDHQGTDGADRFEGTILEIHISSPMPDVARVRINHHKPSTGQPAGFDLDYQARSCNWNVDDQPTVLLITTGNLTLRVSKTDWGIRFLDSAGQLITEADQESVGYMRVKSGGAFLMQRLTLAVGECVYGLGERFGPLVKNGQNVVMWNEDGGTASDLAYKNIPFYLSSRGYGVLVNSPGKVDFEIGTERVSQMQFSVSGEALDYYLFHGPDLKDVLSKYTLLSGRPAMPPAWSFGLWLSTSFTTRYDEKTVMEFIDGMAQRGIPLSVFHFDCFWMKERQWCDFQWDRDAFPDPEGMLQRIKAKGLKICLWINPYISQLSPLFAQGGEHGYFIRRGDGSVFQRDAWQPGMALVDFTNPEARQWYCGKLQKLLDMGVDAFKTDFGELIPVEDVQYFDGSDPHNMHNYYSYLYNKCVFELLETHHGKGNALVFGRAGTTGIQKFPVSWGGDCQATYESMAEDLRGGLSFCMSGPAFWSHDIGGFTGKADAGLYKRWIAFGLMSTHSRLHGSESYRVPWLFDEESVEVMRHFTALKNRLFPYLFSAAQDAARHGWPVLRSMVLEYPDDPACRYLDRQYMLGSSILVAPVFRADGIAEYYLPAGLWTDLLTNRLADGGTWRREPMDYLHLPLFVKSNSVIPISANSAEPLWNVADPLMLDVFDLEDHASIDLRVAAANGREAVFHLQRRGEEIIFTTQTGPQLVRVLLRHCRSVADVINGGQSMQVPEGWSVEWKNLSQPLVIALGESHDPRRRGHLAEKYESTRGGNGQNGNGKHQPA